MVNVFIRVLAVIIIYVIIGYVLYLFLDWQGLLIEVLILVLSMLSANIRNFVFGKETKDVLDLINDYVNSSIVKLKSDNVSNKFEFPDLLNYSYGLSYNKIFSKRRRIMAWRIRKYNEYCELINKKIKNLVDVAKKQDLIEPVHYIKRIIETGGKEGDLLDWTKKYEDLNEIEKKKLLKDKKLNTYIEEIYELLEELSDKSKKLCEKFKKIKIER